MHFISFCFAFARFVLYTFRERKKEAKHADIVLTQLEEQYNGVFDEPTRKKTIFGHSLYNPIIIDAFCSLHGRKSNQEERKRLILYFVCCSLLDNFFDRKELTHDEIQQICFRTSEFLPRNFDERAAIHCHSYLLNAAPDKAGYLKVLKGVVDAQEESLQQFETITPVEKLEAIMKAKGGNALLICRYYLVNSPTEAEDKCWYQLGSILQLNDDLYDLYKDLTDGVDTLATRCRDAYEMERFQEQEIVLLKKVIDTLPYKQKRTFIISIASICASNSMVIHRLKQLQGSADQLPDFRSLERKQLIIDMEKPSNILRWLRYIYHYGRRFNTVS